MCCPDMNLLELPYITGVIILCNHFATWKSKKQSHTQEWTKEAWHKTVHTIYVIRSQPGFHVCPSEQTQPWLWGMAKHRSARQETLWPGSQGFAFFPRKRKQPRPKGHPWLPRAKTAPLSADSPAPGRTATGLGESICFSLLTGQKPHQQTGKHDLGLVLACRAMLRRAEL